jgi:uncharacterized protein DUF6262
MTHQAKRNIEGLRTNAQQKSNDTRRRAEEAIALLLKERRTINFNTVAQTAICSTAWLYANEDIRQQIIHLRSQQIPKAQIKIPAREQASSASKEAMIAALQKRVKEQAEEIKELKKQLEVAYGSLSTR